MVADRWGGAGGVAVAARKRVTAGEFVPRYRRAESARTAGPAAAGGHGSVPGGAGLVVSNALSMLLGN